MTCVRISDRLAPSYSAKRPKPLSAPLLMAQRAMLRHLGGRVRYGSKADNAAGCPLYPQKRTLSDDSWMSAKCQKQTTHQHQKLGDIGRDPSRLIAVFATYPSPTRATSFGRYRKLLDRRPGAAPTHSSARATTTRALAFMFLSGFFLPRGRLCHPPDRGFLALLSRYREQHFGLARDALASFLC
jgi:hypothetical protein